MTVKTYYQSILNASRGYYRLLHIDADNIKTIKNTRSIQGNCLVKFTDVEEALREPLEFPYVKDLIIDSCSDEFVYNNITKNLFPRVQSVILVSGRQYWYLRFQFPRVWCLENIQDWHPKMRIISLQDYQALIQHVEYPQDQRQQEQIPTRRHKE
jgi:hypothetical protein